MNIYASIALTFLTFLSYGQSPEIKLKGDSLIIRDSNITVDPFNFGNNPLTYLTSEVRTSYPEIKISTVPNRHVDNKIDTAYTLKFGKDTFGIYKWSRDDTGLLHAELKTNRFTTKHGIKVGMEKSEIVRMLKAYNLKVIPDFLILENIEYPEYLVFEFNDALLTRIEFIGYFD